MNLLCYLLFYPFTLDGGAARCASTRFPNCQLSIVNSQLSIDLRFPQITKN